MYERLSELCKIEGTTISALCITVTGSSGNLATWKKGYMRSDYLLKCAELLHTSMDYILTGEVPKNKLTDDEKDLLEAFEKLSRQEKRRAIVMIEQMAEKRDDGIVTGDIAAAAEETACARETVGNDN